MAKLTYKHTDISAAEKKYIPTRLLTETMWFLFKDDPSVISVKSLGQEHVWSAFHKLVVTYVQKHDIHVQYGATPVEDELTKRIYGITKAPAADA